MDDEEKIWIRKCLQIFGTENHEFIRKGLVGRTVEDLKRYLADSDPDFSKVIIFMPDKSTTKPLSERTVTNCRIENSFKMRHFAQINESSGSVISLAVGPSSGTFENYCLVGSATNSDPQYNRSGNLLMLKQENHHLECRVPQSVHEMSDGRKCSISSVHYSQSFGGWLTSGYDGKVCLMGWDDWHSPRVVIPHPHRARVNIVKSHPSEPLGSYGTQNGETVLFNQNGIVRCIDTACKSKNPLINSVDCLELYENRLLVGVGLQQELNAGMIDIWNIDNGTLQIVNTIGIPSGLTDFTIHDKYLVTGSGAVTDQVKGDGVVRFFDYKSGNPLFTFQSNSFDIESIRFSPMNNRIFYTTDFNESTVKVWDMNYLKSPIIEKSFRVQDTDPGISACWSPTSQDLVVSGANGTVEIFDLLTSSHPINKIQLNGPVNSLAISPDGCTVWAGLDNGAISILSPFSPLETDYITIQYS